MLLGNCLGVFFFRTSCRFNFVLQEKKLFKQQSLPQVLITYPKNMRQSILSKSSSTNNTVNDSRPAGRHGKKMKKRSDDLAVRFDLENGHNKSNKTELNTDKLHGKKNSISPRYSSSTMKKKENLTGKNRTPEELKIMSVFTSPEWSEKTANKPIVNVVTNKNEERSSDDYSNSNKSIDELESDLHAAFSENEMGYEYENYEILQSYLGEEQDFENISFTKNTYEDLCPEYGYSDYLCENQDSSQYYLPLDEYNICEDVRFDDYPAEEEIKEDTASYLLLYEKMIGRFDDTVYRGEIQKFEQKTKNYKFNFDVVFLFLEDSNIFEELSVNTSVMARETHQQKIGKFQFLYISNNKKNVYHTHLQLEI